jgi:beta-lactam-binding protein with PASTA domain
VRALLVAAVVVAGAAGCAGSSSGTSTMVRVPHEGNSAISSILPRVHAAGLRITIPAGWWASSLGGVGAVIDSPAPGTRVASGSAVTLEIAEFTGLPSQEPGRHPVPRVIGATLAKATAAIAAAELPWGVRATALPPTSTTDLYAVYCVTSQTPAGGTTMTIRRSDDTIRYVALAAKPCLIYPRPPGPR